MVLQKKMCGAVQLLLAYAVIECLLHRHPTVALRWLHSYYLIKSIHAWVSSRYALPYEGMTLLCPVTQEWQKLDAEYVAQQFPASTRRKSLYRL